MSSTAYYVGSAEVKFAKILYSPVGIDSCFELFGGLDNRTLDQ